MTAQPSGFDLLHPALQHHVVNSLGWRSLRRLQEDAIKPIMDGEHVVAVAPTAGGKTEAAVLPLLSRMLTEDWRGLSVLYVCPLRALLNDLHTRLHLLAGLVGRRAGLWHGDIGATARREMLAEPSDLLLTTPESLESMLVSRGVDHNRWFAEVRSVVIDEAHAFAGDDRGWHLLAVLERIKRIAGRDVQRVALSATLGNPHDMLAWLTTGSSAARSGRVVDPVAGGEQAQPEVTFDYVGSLANAAVVISRLHRGEKRLVFVDSRARAEQLALALREHEVTTFVSHGSLGAGERRAAEQAFGEARNCVIVATSTLELGIDVGDLDRVIQVDAPPTVASLLQRLGRTGRRPDSTRNALLLATTDEAMLRSASVLLRWTQGYVEPVTPPVSPYHLIAQQVLALALQESGIGRHLWTEWLGDPFVLGAGSVKAVPAIVDFLVASQFLADDDGLLGIGPETETVLGRQHFKELLSVFVSPPVFSVKHGRTEIGLVPDQTLLARPSGGAPHVLMLAGRNWAVRSIDWPRRVVQVEPTDATGVARWSGSSQPLGSVVARGIRDVLLGADLPGVECSKRAKDKLAQLRDQHGWVEAHATTLVVADPRVPRWWTFAGWKANLHLAQVAASLRREVVALDDLTVALDPTATGEELRKLLDQVNEANIDLRPWVAAEAIDGLKFTECLPQDLATEMVARRLNDHESVKEVISEQLHIWHAS